MRDHPAISTETPRPTLALIDLASLRANYHALRNLSGGSELMVVVKADAYGHGAVTVSRTLAEQGCGHFGVATIDEGRELRDAGIKARIYLLGGFFAEQAREIVALDLTPFVFDTSLIAPLDRCVAAMGRREFPIHLKIDTGATRLGVLASDLPETIGALARARSLKLEGASTLLANAGDPSSPITGRQLTIFRSALESLRAAGMAPKVAHVANSAALVLRADSHFDLTRPGLAVYGLPPVAAVREKVNLQPVMTFKTRLMQLKRVPAGSGVSYGHTFITRRESTVG
ncbi:MAG TPA: alanine racemase, partial [Candidatus Binataceae bacterium]